MTSSVFSFQPTEHIRGICDGRTFAQAGAYDWITGRGNLRIDPKSPENSGIALLNRAVADDDGLVGLSFDIALLTPSDPERANGWLFYDVLNRGTKRAVQRINTGPFSNRPLSVEDMGNGFLLNQGFSILWSGWQGDVPPGANRMLAEMPLAPGVTGLCREEIVLDAEATPRDDAVTELAPGRFRYRLSYPVADRSTSASLTWRLTANCPRALPDGLGWDWVDDRTIEVTHPLLDRGGLYEFIYTARDPMVMGAGLAAIRDTVSAFRHDTSFADGTRNPLAGRIRHALGFGLSQSGRVLRDFLHQGFNADLQGRPVFDAVIPIIAGSRGAFLNHPFAQPGRFSRQHEDHDFPGDQFPFAYQTLTDPISGRTDGILARAQAAGVSPKVMHMDTDSEWWSARASLVVTDCDGRDAVLPDDVRVYLAACVPHGDYALPPQIADGPANTLLYGWLVRALVQAMCDWVETGCEPPASCHPRHADGTMATLEQIRAAFPAIPGVAPPADFNRLHLMDHTVQPPLAGPEYPVGLPAVDTDGNTLGGVRHPLMCLPFATATGWQVRRKGYAEGDLFNVFGSLWAFPARATTGDSRLPLDRRGLSEDRLAALINCLTRLDAAGYLLPEDRDRVLERAAGGVWLAMNIV